MNDPRPLVQTDLPGLTLLNRGKVRDLYDLGDHLLIVTTDRVSAFDVILPTPIPGKGAVLTAMSEFWFGLLGDIVPNHLITTDVEGDDGSLQTEYTLRTKGRLQEVEEFEEIVLRALPDGSAIYLRDVATVRQGYKEREAIIRTNRREAVEVARAL